MLFRERLHLWFLYNRCRLCILFIILVGVITYFYNIKYIYMVSYNDLISSESNNRILCAMNDILDEDYKLKSEEIRADIPLICPNSPPQHYIVTYPTSDVTCKMYSCFNHSKCPLADGFSIYLHDFDKHTPVIKNYTTTSLQKLLSENNYIIAENDEACIYLVIIGEESYERDANSRSSHEHKLSNTTLPNFITQPGSNNVLCNLAQSGFTENIGDAMLAQTTFTHSQFRPGYDVIIPPALSLNTGDVWGQIPPVTSHKRKHLISFQGLQPKLENSDKKFDDIIRILNEMAKSNTAHFFIQFYCKRVDKLYELTTEDWALCVNHVQRRKILQASTFALIIVSTDSSYVSTTVLQTRVYEALESGAIPVILGGDRIRLPYEEVLDWRKAAILLPLIRITELNFLLKTISYEDTLAFRRHGRLFWERYLSSVPAILDSLLATIRSRLNIPPKLEKSLTVMYQYSKQTNKKTKSKPSKIISNRYKQNFTISLLNGYDQWNVFGDPFALHPQLPWDPLKMTESQFMEPLPAKQSKQKRGNLSGYYPIEQFTIVILTYKISTVIHALKRLSALPYLNKIVVVINDDVNMSTFVWPESRVPIVAVQGMKNSLNNNFLPYDLIETEAVLCLDDDYTLTQKGIINVFNIWREYRDQIVGFYDRNYGRNKNKKELKYHNRFKINNLSSPLYEVSMIVTGAAFIHRYYLWAYWKLLPQPIRSFVDTHMNCEDIAMNFLVSHMTRKPPVLVKSDSPNVYKDAKTPYKRLSQRSKHNQIRHNCLKNFTKVMGYNPLLATHHLVMGFPDKPKKLKVGKKRAKFKRPFKSKKRF